MENIVKQVEVLQSCMDEIYQEIDAAEQTGFVYNRAKNIRKAAQALKAAAQDLRSITTDEFKKTQGVK